MQQNVHNALNDFGHFLNGLNPFSERNKNIDRVFNFDATNAQMVANEASKASGKSIPSDYVSKTANANLLDALNNAFTGNLDYQRTLETLQKEQAFTAEQAKIAREFQEYMSRNSHQMEADDLRAIGLNPALTLTSGGANAYTASSVSSPGAREFNSGKGFSAMLNLLMGLVSLGVNNARKVDAIDRSLDLTDKKINANIIQNDAKLDAMSAHWNKQDNLAQAKLSSYDWMNIEKADLYKKYLERLAYYKMNKR